MKYLFQGVGLISSLSLFILGLATIIYAFVEGYHVIDEILKFSSSEAHVISDAMSLLDLILLSFSIFITSFMGRAVTWDGQANLFNYGIAIASVILALSYFLSTKKSTKSKTDTQ